MVLKAGHLTFYQEKDQVLPGFKRGNRQKCRTKFFRRTAFLHDNDRLFCVVTFQNVIDGYHRMCLGKSVYIDDFRGFDTALNHKIRIGIEFLY